MLLSDALNMPANLENSAEATGLEKVGFHSIPKEGNAKECFNYHTIVLISHASKVMLKILQARLQQYVKRELTDVYTSWVSKRQRNQKSNCQHPLDQGKARKFQKNIYFCFIDCTKAFDCVDHNTVWKILKEIGIPDHLTCLLRNLYATGHGTMD